MRIHSIDIAFASITLARLFFPDAANGVKEMFASRDEGAWSPIGEVVLIVVLMQLPFAVATATRMAPLAGPMVFPAQVGLALGSILVLQRCRTPRWARTGGPLLLAIALLAVAATQDVFGMRAINRQVDTALNAASVASAVEPDAPSRPAQVALRPGPGRSDNGFAEAFSRDTAAHPLPTGEPGIAITGATEYRHDAGRDRYDLNWSVHSDGDFAWCGTISVFTRTRDVAVRLSRDILAEAIAASTTKHARCFEPIAARRSTT